MKGVGDYTVVYDLSSDRERRRVDKTLKSFGFRVQKSVFECRLSRKWRDELIEKLKQLELKSGFVKLYRLEYSSKEIEIGVHGKKDIDEEHAYVI